MTLNLAYFHIAGPAIKVEVQVFNFPIFCKFVHHVFLCRFFMHICNENDPTLNSCPPLMEKHGMATGKLTSRGPGIRIFMGWFQTIILCL